MTGRGSTTMALLGTGAMGTRVGARLIAAGHDLVVYNRMPERAAPLAALGARVAATPADAARGAWLVMSMVRDVPASRSVWLDPATGAAGAMQPGAIAVESGTVTPEWIGELGQAIGERGVDLLDAPVVGSRPQAEAGGLVYLVGGDSRAVARATPLLEAAGRVEHVGRAGDGAALKLAVNGLYAVQVAMMGEVLALLDRAGVDSARAVEVLRALPVTSPALGAAAGAMEVADFAPAFPIELVAKDLGYLLALADSLGAQAPGSATAAALYEQSVAAGDGGLNAAGIVRQFDRPG